MQTAITVLCRLNSAENLCKIFEVKTIKEIWQAIEQGYKPYKKLKKGKYRWVEQPNDDLKLLQQKLLEFLQKHLECPIYCKAGFKGQNNIRNAKTHIGKNNIKTMDIAHFFPNTSEKYVRKFFAETLGATGDVLDLLVKLTTYNGYLPTGAPTSTLLSCFVHKEVFDSIYKKMKSLDIDMTVYVDDITLSTHKYIGNWVIKYINNALKTHGLYLKKSKTKSFGYKHSVVTGVHIAQCGKLSAPFSIGHSVIEVLKKRQLTEMSITELQEIIAKISYIQQFQPNKMAVTKGKAIRQLKRLQKIENNSKLTAQNGRKEKLC